MATDKLVFNGINGATGDYLLSNLTPQEVGRLARGEKLDPSKSRSSNGGTIASRRAIWVPRKEWIRRNWTKRAGV